MENKFINELSENFTLEQIILLKSNLEEFMEALNYCGRYREIKKLIDEKIFKEGSLEEFKKTQRWLQDDWDADISNDIRFYGTQHEYNQTVMTKINYLSTQIDQSDLKGSANIIMTTAKVNPLLQNFCYFTKDYRKCEGYEITGIIGNKRTYTIISSDDKNIKDDEIYVIRLLKDEDTKYSVLNILSMEILLKHIF